MDAAASAPVGGLYDNGVGELQAVKVGVLIDHNALRARISVFLKCLAHQVLVGGDARAFHAVPGKPQLIGDIVHGIVAEIRRDAADPADTDFTALFGDLVLLYNADGVEVISRLLTDVICRPCEHVRGESHTLRLFNKRELQIACPDNRKIIFHIFRSLFHE